MIICEPCEQQKFGKKEIGILMVGLGRSRERTTILYNLKLDE